MPTHQYVSNHSNISDTLTQDASYSTEFDRDLVCSTPLKPRSRKTSSVSNVSNTTFKCDNDNKNSDDMSRNERKEESPWEQWIMKKALEESILMASKKKSLKEERRKVREEQREKEKDLEQQKIKIDQWMKVKDESFKTEREKKRIEKINQKREKQNIRAEVQHKTASNVNQWKSSKEEDLKKLKEQRIALEAETKLIQEEKRALANKKYDEWLEKHRPQSTPPPKPRNIFEAPSPGCNNPAYNNPKPWDSETSIERKQHKIMYTSFG